jgi:glycosyltransferase 2 family protein
MKWKLVLGLVLSALFLWLASRGVRWPEIRQILAGARFWLLVPIVALTMLAYLIRAWRWHFLLIGVGRIPISALWSSIMVGFMGNNILPARLGELLRAHSLGRNAGVSRSAALASVVVERILDIAVLLLIFGLFLVLHRLPPGIGKWGGIVLALAAPILAFLIVFELKPEAVWGLLERFLPARLRPPLRKVAMNFRDGLRVLRQPVPLLAGMLLSVLMWAVLVVVVILTLAALRLTTAIDAAAVVLVVMALGTMIPAAPGYIGTLQAAGTLALVQYGVPQAAAFSFTVLYHAGQWLPVTVIGLIVFMRENLSLRRLGDLSAAVDGPDPEPGRPGRHSGETRGQPIEKRGR